MDRQYLLEHNLMKAHSDFMRLCNEGYISTSLEEAGEPEQDPQGAGQEPPMGPDAQGGAPMPPADGAPGADPNTAPPMDGGDPNAIPGGPDAQGGAPIPSEDGAPEPPMDSEPPIEDGESQEDNDVLDVEDLTQAQEKLNKKENMVGQDLGKLDSRIENLLTVVEKMKGMIDHNNSEVIALKAELQKRVPTQTERLNMRSLDSYPYNVNPDDYWTEKAKEGVYQPIGDNNQPKGKQEYVITNDDVNNYSDSEIENSFNDIHQTMDDIFKKW